MIKNDNTQRDDWVKKFIQKVQAEPLATPEEIAQNKAENEQRTPTKYRTISIDGGGIITVTVNQFGPNGIRACGDHEIKPGEEYYEEALRDCGCLKPGESHVTIEKLIDGKWIEQELNHPDSHVA